MDTGYTRGSSKSFSLSPRFITLAGVVLIAVGVLYFALAIRNGGPFQDFGQDYRAGRALYDGGTIYDPTFDNNHTPFDALVVAPFVLLPFGAAFLLWSLISLACLGLIGWLVLSELQIDLARHWLVLLTGLALCWFPTLAHMALGQWSLLLAACVIGAWALLRRRRERLAGVLIGVAILIKLFPGLLVLYLLLRRRWWAAGAAIAAFALGMLLTVAIVGPGDTLYFFRHVAASNTEAYQVFPINLSFTGVYSRLLVDGAWVRPLVAAPKLAWLLTSLTSLAALTLLARQLRRAKPGQLGEDVLFSLTCLAMLLISPITWQHGLSLLLLPFGLLLRELLARPRRWMVGLTLLAVVLVSLPDRDIARALMAAYAPNRMPWFAALSLLGATIGLIVLWGLLITLLRPGEDSPLEARY